MTPGWGRCWSTPATAGPVREVVRIESVAEAVLTAGGPPTDTLDGLVDAFEERIVAAIEGGAVALKSVLAYRAGLRMEPVGVGELRSAFEALDLAAQARRFDDPVLGPLLARRAAEIAALWSVPLQFHTGFGDEDVRMPGADPTLLRPLLHDSRTEACPIVLLHCYPFVSGAAVMAGTYPQVYLDLSLAIPLAEPIAAHLVREALGLCPAGKLMAASDGHSFPEMHWWGAIVWRRALATVLGAEVDRGDLDQPAADEISSRILGRAGRPPSIAGCWPGSASGPGPAARGPSRPRGSRGAPGSRCGPCASSASRACRSRSAPSRCARSAPARGST